MEKDKEILALQIELVEAKTQSEIMTIRREAYEKILIIKEEALRVEIDVMQKSNESLQKLLEEYNA